MKLKNMSLVFAVIVLAAVLTLFIAVPGLKKPDTISSATVAPPVITSISPSSGRVGSTVTIRGSVFGSSRGSSHVLFGSSKASSYSSWASTKVLAKVPSAANGTVKIKVVTSGGTSNYRSFKVAPTITSYSPHSGKSGTLLTLNGRAFRSARGSSYVYFGTRKATSYSFWSNTKIKVRVPAGSTGGIKVKVVVTTGGTSNYVVFTRK